MTAIARGELKSLWKYTEDGSLDTVDVVVEKHKNIKGAYSARLVKQSETFPMVVEKVPVSYEGPMVAYPISRFLTPESQYCVDDLMKNCLGMEACAYVLDVEALQPQYRGIFTCSYGKTPAMFLQPTPMLDYDIQAAETWKDDRAFMRRETRAVNVFITFIQDRINIYADLRLELLIYLKEAEAKYSDQVVFINKLRNEMNKPIPYYETTEPPDWRAKGEATFEPWMAEMIKATLIDTPDQAREGFAAAGAPSIGNKQDAILASCRRRVKSWRSMATMEMTRNPKVADIAKEIRSRTEKALRNPSNYERETVWVDGK